MATYGFTDKQYTIWFHNVTTPQCNHVTYIKPLFHHCNTITHGIMNWVCLYGTGPALRTGKQGI